MRLAAGVRPACRQSSPVPTHCYVSLALLKPMRDISVRRVSSDRSSAQLHHALTSAGATKAGLVAPRDIITMLIALYL